MSKTNRTIIFTDEELQEFLREGIQKFVRSFLSRRASTEPGEELYLDFHHRDVRHGVEVEPYLRFQDRQIFHVFELFFRSPDGSLSVLDVLAAAVTKVSIDKDPKRTIQAIMAKVNTWLSRNNIGGQIKLPGKSRRPWQFPIENFDSNITVAKNLYNTATELLSDGKHEEALEQFLNAYETDPDNREVLILSADLLIQAEKTTDISKKRIRIYNALEKHKEIIRRGISNLETAVSSGFLKDYSAKAEITIFDLQSTLLDIEKKLSDLAPHLGKTFKRSRETEVEIFKNFLHYARSAEPESGETVHEQIRNEVFSRFKELDISRIIKSKTRKRLNTYKLIISELCSLDQGSYDALFLNALYMVIQQNQLRIGGIKSFDRLVKHVADKVSKELIAEFSEKEPSCFGVGLLRLQ